MSCSLVSLGACGRIEADPRNLINVPLVLKSCQRSVADFLVATRLAIHRSWRIEPLVQKALRRNIERLILFKS
jgi:hypothetical protein